MVWVQEHLSGEERLRKQSFFSLEKRRLQEDPIAAFQIPMGSSRRQSQHVHSDAIGWTRENLLSWSK